MDKNEPRAYPLERNNGDRPKRKVGRPRGSKNPNAGRPKGIPNPNGGRKPARIGFKSGARVTIALVGDPELPAWHQDQLGNLFDGLSEKETAFVIEYLVDMNATKALGRSGYSDKDSNVSAYLILNRPHVRKAVDDLLEIRARNSALMANRLLVGLDELAHFDKADLLAEDGTFLPIEDWPVVARQALTGLDIEEIWSGRGEDRVQVGVVKKARFVDPLRARELLGRHLKLWGEPHINIDARHQEVNIGPRLDFSHLSEDEAMELRNRLAKALDGQVLEIPGYK